MATTNIGDYQQRRSNPYLTGELETGESALDSVRALLMPLASLKITVGLFAISLVLVLAGTTAQRYYDVQEVLGWYFRTWIAHLDVRDFLPGTRAPMMRIYYPGGWTIGTALAVNLLAAHSLRFRIQSKGNKRLLGLVAIAFGTLVTFLVIKNGLDDTVRSQLPPEFCAKLWAGLKAALLGTTLVSIYLLTLAYKQAGATASRALWWLGAVVTGLIAVLSAWLFVNPDVALDPSGLRILWQLIQGTGASLILWFGCWLLFAKRAGVVLLHAGIGLMLYSEVHTAINSVETHIRMVEGETVSFAEDLRYFELAVVDKSGEKADQEVVVPIELLSQVYETAENSDALLSNEALPFDVKIQKLYPNAELRELQPGQKSPATLGVGQAYRFVEKGTSTGVDLNQAFDSPGAVVELIDKSSGNTLGVLSLYPTLPGAVVEADEKSYEVRIRPKPYDKPYTLTLLDFERKTYVGSDKTKSFKSIVQLKDSELGVDRRVEIWMNNPLRYRGDTIYQSSFDPGNLAYTDLQAVKNSGWMIPYVACMIVGTGMLAHFGTLLLRFVRRRDEEELRRASSTAADNDRGSLLQNWSSPKVWVPALVVLGFAGYVAGKVRVPQASPLKMQLSEFGQLPVVQGGRVQPIDSLARNSLRAISLSEELRLTDGSRQPAIKWLLDTVTESDEADEYRVLRIESLDLLGALGLEPRKGFRYSLQEVQGENAGDKLNELREDAREAAISAKESGTELEPIHNKVLELGQRYDQLAILRHTFSAPTVDEEVLKKSVRMIPGIKSPQELVERTLEVLGVTERIRLLKGLQNSPPQLIPPATPEESWQLLPEAARDFAYNEIRREPVNEGEAFLKFQEMLAAYQDDDPGRFNTALKEYQALIKQLAEAEAEFETALLKRGEIGRKPAERLSLDRLKFEAYFNHMSPFYLCCVLYVAAFVFAALGLLGWSEGFNRTANWLLWMTFGLHTVALLCRIYISGRPPVTNLYSSAVFIGWAGVLFALLFEKVYRNGMGNLLAPIKGFPTLIIAYFLAADGDDTFEVMQAVLDTQFWLATHVVTITLGYATTFMAGGFGLVYLLESSVGRFTTERHKQLQRMIYGLVCFSILFSFIGTVLGGLWADDSWGRFWGWDPKENGALMIVIWNAIVLHARWGKMIGERGLAALAVFGNIVVAWSWFGVNLLSVGLHSYGFTENGSFYFGLFALSQLLLMQLAWVPISKEQKSRRSLS